MLYGLGNNVLLNNPQSPLVNLNTIRIHMASDQSLTKAPSSLNHNLRRIPIIRVNSENDAGAFRVDHFLHAHADENFLMREALLLPVEDGTWSVEA